MASLSNPKLNENSYEELVKEFLELGGSLDVTGKPIILDNEGKLIDIFSGILNVASELPNITRRNHNYLSA